jgi:hypothetical protein
MKESFDSSKRCASSLEKKKSKRSAISVNWFLCCNFLICNSNKKLGICANLWGGSDTVTDFETYVIDTRIIWDFAKLSATKRAMLFPDILYYNIMLNTPLGTIQCICSTECCEFIIDNARNEQYNTLQNLKRQHGLSTIFFACLYKGDKYWIIASMYVNSGTAIDRMHVYILYKTRRLWVNKGQECNGPSFEVIRNR